MAVLGLSLVMPLPAQGPVTPAPAQKPPAGAAPAAKAVPAAGAAAFSQQELEQLVAPIALYPDSLLAQVLMASTYPLEVVEAARWVEGEPEAQGQGARGRAAEADVGPEREVAGRVPAGARR